MNAVAHGLEGVVVAETRLSEVDGEKGVLIIAGTSVEGLAGRTRFEALCARLWGVPEVSLGEARVAAFERLGSLGEALSLPDGMDALRAAVAQLPSTLDAVALTGAVGVFAASWARRQAGLPVLRPDPRAGHAADVLRLMTGDSNPTCCT